MKGTTDIPTPRSLCYRVRRVDEDGEVSAWSSPAMVTVNPVQTGEIAEGSITAPKLRAKLYGDQGGGDKIGYWSFDDTIGDRTPEQIGLFKDTSAEGASNHLYVSGTELNAVNGITEGRGLYIDGGNNNSFVLTEPIGNIGDSWPTFSMLGFIKGDEKNLPNRPRWGLLSYYFNQRNYLNITYSNGNRNLFFQHNGTTFASFDIPITRIFDNAWHMVGLVYDGPNEILSGYFDGIKVADVVEPEILPHSNSSRWQIHCWWFKWWKFCRSEISWCC